MSYCVYLLPVPLAGSTTVLGTSLDDALGGYGGDDTLIGGLGDDLVFEGVGIWDGPSSGAMAYGVSYDFGLGNDLINGGGGFDIVFYLGSTRSRLVDLKAGTISNGSETDTLVSVEGIVLTEASDRVIANRGGYVVDLGDGKDVLVGIAGVSEYYGGAGSDTIDLRGYAGAADVRFEFYTANVGGIKDVYVEGFENIYGVVNFRNVLYGNSSANYFLGGNLGDVFFGRDGDDRLNGAAGNDSIFGGWGSDILWGSYGDDALNGEAGNDTIYGSDGNDLIWGSAGDDRLDGGAGDDLLADTDGYDIMIGGDGNDKIKIDRGEAYGGNGNDYINIQGWSTSIVHGGDGDDFVYIHQGNGDSILNGGNGIDTVSIGGGHFMLSDIVVTPPSSGVLLVGFENVVTHAYGFTMHVAVSSRHLIFGDGASDFEISGDQNYLSAGDGNHLVYVYGSDNTVILGTGRCNVIVFSDRNDVTTGAGGDFVSVYSRSGSISTGDGNDSLTQVDVGTSSATTLTIDLGAGNDDAQLDSFVKDVDLGDGDDFASVRYVPAGLTLHGGSGADTFRFESFGVGDSTITDFNPNEDTILFQLVSSLADVTRVTQLANAVELFFDDVHVAGTVDGFSLVLSNLTINDLNDGMFS